MTLVKHQLLQVMWTLTNSELRVDYWLKALMNDRSANTFPMLIFYILKSIPVCGVLASYISHLWEWYFLNMKLWIHIRIQENLASFEIKNKFNSEVRCRYLQYVDEKAETQIQLSKETNDNVNLVCLQCLCSSLKTVLHALC